MLKLVKNKKEFGKTYSCHVTKFCTKNLNDKHLKTFTHLLKVAFFREKHNKKTEELKLEFKETDIEKIIKNKSNIVLKNGKEKPKNTNLKIN